jgi:Holliday junction DNA helicase RuvA
MSGTLVEHRRGAVLVDIGGLAYEVTLPPCVEDKLPREAGAPLSLEIHATFSLEGNSGRFAFFGFTNAIEREFFEALISVASIGPKTAARAFTLPMARIAQAIDAGDHTFLRTLPGIGQQKARDIVAKLQGKVAKFLLIQDARPQEQAPIPDFAHEALGVLLQLEYKRSEAEAMIARTLETSPHVVDAETLLAEIYRTKHREAAAP